MGADGFFQEGGCPLTMTRKRALETVSALLASIHLAHPLRVGIDGIDAAGKTMLADELAALLRKRGRPVIRASVDGFHQPRQVRYRKGRLSPQGYYQDSFQYQAIVQRLLAPLGPGGTRRYQPAIFDVERNAERRCPWREAQRDAILLLDGVFLQRPALRAYWDFVIFVQVAFEVALPRAQSRDRPLLGGPAEVRRTYERRYWPAQRRYLESMTPARRAHLIWENNDLENPNIRGNRPAG